MAPACAGATVTKHGADLLAGQHETLSGRHSQQDAGLVGPSEKESPAAVNQKLVDGIADLGVLFQLGQ